MRTSEDREEPLGGQGKSHDSAGDHGGAENTSKIQMGHETAQHAERGQAVPQPEAALEPGILARLPGSLLSITSSSSR